MGVDDNGHIGGGGVKGGVPVSGDDGGFERPVSEGGADWVAYACREVVYVGGGVDVSSSTI